MKKALCLAVALFGLNTAAEAVTITFDDDPFAGSTALTTPGRQVVANELFTSFDLANDVFQFDESIFGVSELSFANGEIGSIPGHGTNLAILRTFDNDANPTTPFGAGNAANLLADQITTPGAGFFVYFNSGLDLARLVFSTDLSDNTADLKVLARLTNFTGQAGRDALANVSAGNFSIAEATSVPTPGTLSLFGLGLIAVWFMRRKQTTQDTLALPSAALA
jgi:PEP-CTERM motif